jgi:Lrp/AsnC family transcriptional regulator for asnA, asnC and gidA
VKTVDSAAPSRLDDVDRRIIALLQPDGRRSFASMAHEIGVSEGTIRQRYHRLVEEGILQVVGVADPFRVGFHFMAMIGVNVAIDGARSIDDVAHEISRFPEVSYAVMSSGSFDLLVEVTTETSDEYVSFLADRLHAVPGVRRTETFVLLRVYKMNLGGWRMVEIQDRRRRQLGNNGS